MPKLYIRADGTCYTKVKVTLNPHTGLKGVRTFEIDHRGKQWLADRGVTRREQEFEHHLFSTMKHLGYIDSRQGKSEPTIVIRSLRWVRTRSNMRPTRCRATSLNASVGP